MKLSWTKNKQAQNANQLRELTESELVAVAGGLRIPEKKQRNPG